MAFLLLLPTFLCAILMAAHCLRSGSLVLVGLSLLFPLILLIKRRWVKWTTQIVLVLWAAEWLRSLMAIAAARQEAAMPWLRMAIILSAVAGLNLVAAALFQTRRLRERYV